MLIESKVYGYRGDESQPFKVRLHDFALHHLIADAMAAYRVYESMAIQRPGDVWKYFWVELLDVPKPVYSSREWRKNERKDPESYRWPEDWIPLVEFDRCFRNDGDDTRPESECWLDIRHNAGFNQQAETLFSEVKQVQAELRQSQDRMIQVELAMIDQRRHPLDCKVELPLSRTHADYTSPTKPKFSPEFYEKMAGLIAEPEVRALSLSVEDFQCLKLACIEQRKRSSEDPLQMARDWYLSLGNGTDGVLDGWNAEALIFSEGLGYGDLLVSLDVYDRLLRQGRFRRLFCREDAGELDGYRRESGPGWVLYEDLMPEEEYAKWSGMHRWMLETAWKKKK